jgi:hypothetical protein
MSNGISVLYSEFTAALTEVLAENAVGPARRGRLARARAAVSHDRLARARAAVSHDLETMNKRLRVLEAKSAQEGLVAIHSRIPGLHATSTNYYTEPVWNRNFRLVRAFAKDEPSRGSKQKRCCVRTVTKERNRDETQTNNFTHRHRRAGACRRKRSCFSAGQFERRIRQRRNATCHAADEPRRDERPTEPGRAVSGARLDVQARPACGGERPYDRPKGAQPERTSLRRKSRIGPRSRMRRRARRPEITSRRRVRLRRSAIRARPKASGRAAATPPRNASAQAEIVPAAKQI